PGHPVQADDVARRQLAAPHLDDEVGAPGQEAPLGAKAGPEVDRLRHRRRLVVLEAHVRLRGARANTCLFGGRIPSPKSRAVTSYGHRDPSSRAARWTRGASRCRRDSGRRNDGPETATAPTTRFPWMIGAARARPSSASSPSVIA